MFRLIIVGHGKLLLRYLPYGANYTTGARGATAGSHLTLSVPPH
jgi:hypothetical protein